MPPSTITWEARQSCSTIDLVFLSTRLATKVKHCKTRPEIGQSSDHIPVSTKLLLECKAATICPRQAWKMIDMEKLKNLLKQAPQPQYPQNIANINTAVKKVQDFLCHIVDQTVPWAKPSDWSKPFWSKECNTTMENTRRLWKIWSTTRHQEDWRIYMKANDQKQKIIDKAKRLHY